MRTLFSSDVCLTLGRPLRNHPWQSSSHELKPIPRLPFAHDDQIYGGRPPLQVDSWSKQGDTEREGRKGSQGSWRRV